MIGEKEKDKGTNSGHGEREVKPCARPRGRGWKRKGDSLLEVG